MAPTDFSTVTEVTGNRVTQDQLERLYHRYTFAAQFCDGMDVLEVACGAGQGLGYLAKKAKLVVGGDYMENLLRVAQRYYSGRVPLLRLDAHVLPFRDSSFDVVLLYEAIYYLANPEYFLDECRRVLRERGMLLLCTVNKEWSDFNPSPFSTRYFTARELLDLLHQHQFQVQLSGAFPTNRETIKDDIISFLKRAAVSLDLMPKTMKGKELLKRIFFGPLQALPPEVFDGMASYCHPVRISEKDKASNFKILFAIATL